MIFRDGATVFPYPKTKDDHRKIKEARERGEDVIVLRKHDFRKK